MSEEIKGSNAVDMSTKKASIFTCKQCKQNNVEVDKKPK